MIEGIIWFLLSVASALAVIKTIPKAIVNASHAWRQRNVEQPTLGPLNVVCPQDAGEWGNWSSVQTDYRSENPTYPNISNKIATRSQVRQCQTCGYAERRVI